MTTWTIDDLAWDCTAGAWTLTVARDGDELVFRSEHLANVHDALDRAGAGYGNPVSDRIGLTRLHVTDLDSLTMTGIRVLEPAPALAAA